MLRRRFLQGRLSVALKGAEFLRKGGRSREQCRGRRVVAPAGHDETDAERHCSVFGQDGRHRSPLWRRGAVFARYGARLRAVIAASKVLRGIRKGFYRKSEVDFSKAPKRPAKDCLPGRPPDLC